MTNQQQNWIEWIKKLPAWTKGAIGLVTAIAGLVVLFRNDFYLGVTISGLLFLATTLCVYLYVYFAKTPPLLEGGKGVYRFETFRPLALVGIGFVFVLVLMILIFQPSRSFIVTAFVGTATPSSTPTTTPTPTPMPTATATPEVYENPVAVHNEFFSVFEYPGYDFLEDVDTAQRIHSESEEAGVFSPQSEIWSDYLASKATPVLMSSEATLSFDIENEGEFFSANLDQILVEVEQDPTPFAEIFKHMPGAGGAAWLGFQVMVEYDTSPGAPRLQTFIASPAEGEDFDFITLLPGERNSILLNIGFASPGLYQVTPVAELSYRDQNYEYRFDTIEVLIPEQYRIWSSQNGELRPSFVIHNNTTGELEFTENLLEPANPSILFESTITDGLSRGIYIAEGDSIFPLMVEMTYGSWNAEWSDDGNQVIYEDHDYPISPGEPKRVWAYDLLTETTLDLGPVSTGLEESNLLERMNFEYGLDPASVSISPDGRFSAVVIESNNGLEYNLTHSGFILLVETDTLNIITRIRGASAWCGQPSWAPDSQRFAYICEFDSDNDGIVGEIGQFDNEEVGHLAESGDETELWIANKDGATMRVSPSRGRYWHPSWSQDGQQILVGGDGLRIFDANTSLPPTTILDADLGFFYNPSWRP